MKKLFLLVILMLLFTGFVQAANISNYAEIKCGISSSGSSNVSNLTLYIDDTQKRLYRVYGSGPLEFKGQKEVFNNKLIKITEPGNDGIDYIIIDRTTGSISMLMKTMVGSTGDPNYLWTGTCSKNYYGR